MLRKIGLLALFFGMFAGCWIVAVVLIGWSRSSFPSLLLAIGSVWIVVASLILIGRQARPGPWLVIGLVVLAAMLLAPTQFFEHEPGGPPAIARNPALEFLLSQLLPALAPLMAALLVTSGFLSLPDQSVAEHGANIVSYVGAVEDQLAKNRYTVEVGDVKSLRTLLNSLRNLDAVFDAYRVTPS